MWVPRLGRNRISGTSWPAQTPAALMTVRARMVRDSPVRESVSVALSPRASLTLTRVCTRAPLAAAVRATREHEAYVVLELAVPGQDRAAQPFTSYDGGEGERLGDTDPAWPGERLAAGPRGQPQQVTGADAVACQRGLGPPDARGERHQHRQRPDQVWGGGLHQDAPLDGALVGHVQLALRQVAQPAVDQLGAPAAGAEGDVLGVDGDHVEPAGGSVERNAGAGDAEADHEDVGPLGDVVETDVDLPGGHGCRNRCTS